MGNIVVRVVTESQELDSLIGVWEYLLQKSGDDNSIFLTFEWILSWWHHLGGGNRLNILVFEKAGEPVGIIPLMKSRYSIGPFGVSVLETIGATNDNRVGLISAGSGEEVMVAFLTYLKDRLAEQSFVVRLELVPDDSQFLRALRDRCTLFSNHLFSNERTISLAPYLLLPQTWEEYFSSRSLNMRKMLRRMMRRLKKTHSVEYKQFAPDSIQTGLNILFELHEKRWKSVNIRSPFFDPKMKEFYNELTLRLLAKDWLHFSHLSVDGKVVSVIYAFVFNRRFLAATGARDLGYSKYRVGHIHHMYAIRDAITKQLREFDLLRGDEPYKFHWTDKFRRYLRVTIISNKFCSSLRLKILILFLRLAEIIRNKHSLKELYALYMLERSEKREKKKMGLLYKLK